jgi:hypothetical protein
MSKSKHRGMGLTLPICPCRTDTSAVVLRRRPWQEAAQCQVEFLK